MIIIIIIFIIIIILILILVTTIAGYAKQFSSNGNLDRCRNVTSNQIYLVVNSHRYGKPIVSQETRSRHDGYTHANKHGCGTRTI
jgi:competence protein ComGC